MSPETRNVDVDTGVFTFLIYPFSVILYHININISLGFLGKPEGKRSLSPNLPSTLKKKN